VERVDGRAGHYERKRETKAGEVTLRVAKLRWLRTCQWKAAVDVMRPRTPTVIVSVLSDSAHSHNAD
jgi:hypothetical protein